MAKTITHKINGQEYEVPEGYTKLDVMRALSEQNKPKQLSPSLPVKSYDSKTNLPEQTNAGWAESYLRGLGRETLKSGTGLGQFVTGKQFNLPEEPEELTLSQRLGRFLGEQTAGIGKTAAGFTAGAKLGAPFGPIGRGIGALSGAFASHYLTQPGERLSLERAKAGAGGLTEALAYGTGHPERRMLEKGIKEAEQKIPAYETALKSLAQPKQAAEQTLEAEKLASRKEMGISDIGALEYRKSEAQKELPRGEQKLKQIEAKANLKEIFKPEENKTHGVNIYKMMKQRLAEKQQSLGELYTKFKEKHAGKQIETGVQKSANQIIEELPEPGTSELFGMGAKSAEELGHEVDAKITPITKDINTVFDNWRSLKRYAQRALGKARAAGEDLSQDEKNDLIAKANLYEQAAVKLENLIKENDARANTNYAQSLEELKGINQRYANEYAPIYDTNVFWSMRKQGKAPSNFLEAIEGEHPGKEILRNIVQGDEKLLKSSLGQMLEKKPESAFEADKKALLNPYLAKHEQSQKWYDQLKTSMGYMSPEQRQQFGLVQEALKIQEAAKTARTPDELQNIISNADEYIARIKKAEENLEKANQSIKITKEQIAENEKLITNLQDQRKKLHVLKTGLASALLRGGAGAIRKVYKLGKGAIKSLL